MNGPVSDRLIAWAAQAGFAFSQDIDAGESVFWSDPGGETRIYLNRRDSRFIVREADRGSGKSDIFAAATSWPVDCYLFDFFGPTVRSRQKLPFLDVPTRADQVANGFRVVNNQSGDIDLLSATGDIKASSFRGLIGIVDLVVVSHLLEASIDQIEATYLSVDGNPIFPQTSP